MIFEKTNYVKASVFFGLCLLHGVSQSTGRNGFPPDDQNVIVPTTGLPTTVWKQVGSGCGTSSVQISPSWILSTNHAPCVAGMRFRRSDGTSELADFEPPTMPGQTPLSSTDIKLTRLARPLPYPGRFVPLAYDVKHEGVPLFSSMDATTRFACKFGSQDISFLTAGFGISDEVRWGRFQVGWHPLWATAGFQDPTNPLETQYKMPGATTNDSGGGVFLFLPNRQNPFLFGLMHSWGWPSGAGFTSAVKAQIDAVLADPVMNPSGESVNWVNGNDVLADVFADVQSVRRMPPMFFNNGGQSDGRLVPEFGLITQTTLQQATLRIPMPASCDQGVAPSAPYGYRIRYVQLNTPANLYVPVRQQDVLAAPNGGTHAILSFGGVTPMTSDWRVKVSTLDRDEATGDVYESSKSLGVVDFHLKEKEPVAKVMDVQAKFMYSTDGGQAPKQTFFDVVAELKSSPPYVASEGVLFRIAGRYEWVQTNEGTFKTYPLSVWQLPLTPGQVIRVTAWPYNGARLGAGSVFEFVVPESITCDADTGDGC